MSWLVAAYAAVAVGVALYILRIRRLRRELPPPAEPRPPRS